MSAVDDAGPATCSDGCVGDAGVCRGGGVDAASSSSSTNMEKPDREAFKFVTIKEEEEEEEDTGTVDEIAGGGWKNYGYNGSSNSSSSSMVLPKPMEGLHESGPPPFLKKTFEMVESTETDPIVSWSKTRDSFVVWDSQEFSKHLLPKYFKHSNFSSFIRQLNTYGFRKIDPDRWEFANEGFQGGKKHLLKKIKRSRYSKQHNEATSGLESPKLGSEFELENLKNEQDALKLEILKLRRQQEDSDNQLSAVEERIRATQCKQLQMFVFFIKAAKNPGIIHHIIQKRKKQGELDGGEFSKKRKLLPTQVLECLHDAVDTSQTVNCGNQAQEKLATMQPELTEMLTETLASSSISRLSGSPMNDEYCSPTIRDRDGNSMCGTSSEDVSSVYNLMLEKLMDDSSVAKSSVDVDPDLIDPKFYLELEDLIGKTRNWGGFAAELVEGAGYVG